MDAQAGGGGPVALRFGEVACLHDSQCGGRAGAGGERDAAWAAGAFPRRGAAELGSAEADR